jgi:hypothetical protein
MRSDNKEVAMNGSSTPAQESVDPGCSRGTVTKKSGVVVCITTHDRTDCARINMEIVKLNYAESWPVVHACSDLSYDSYLEDELVRCEPLPLVHGALNLLREAVRRAVEKYNPAYIVHLEADTWVFDQTVIDRYINLLARDERSCVAASSWSTDQRPEWCKSKCVFRRFKYRMARVLGLTGIDVGIRRRETLATQFFVAKNDKKFLDALDGIEPVQGHSLERDFYLSMTRALGRKAIVGMPEREPVHPTNRHQCEKLTLYCQHWPERPTPHQVGGASDMSTPDMPGKKEALTAGGMRRSGPAMRRLLESSDLDYYNAGAKRF